MEGDNTGGQVPGGQDREGRLGGWLPHMLKQESNEKNKFLDLSLLLLFDFSPSCSH